MESREDFDHLQAEVRRRLSVVGCMHVHLESLGRRDWWGVIASATTSDYWSCFDALASLMSDAEYAATVREIWTATNGLSPQDAERRLLQHGRAITREMWMTTEDRSTFVQLPEQITLYRGGRQGCESGWSWSLDRETAEHFAFGLTPDDDRGGRVVVRGTAAKRDIIALFTGNWDEREVIVPGTLVAVLAVSPARQD